MQSACTLFEFHLQRHHFNVNMLFQTCCSRSCSAALVTCTDIFFRHQAAILVTFETEGRNRKQQHKIEFLSLTGGVGEVEDAGGRLQQVGAAGRQISRYWHDGHAVTTLLGADDAVVLRLTHASVAGVEIRDGAEEKG